MEITYGQYAMPVILTVILGIIYKAAGSSIPDRAKPVISVLIGLTLGILWVPYSSLDWSMKNIIDHLIYGLMVGASAVGLYEIQRTATKPRQ